MGERLFYRDLRISRLHRLLPKQAYMTDLDCIELNCKAEPIAVISTKLIPIDDMSPDNMPGYVEKRGYLQAFDTRAYITIANRLDVPGFLIVYQRSLTSLYVFPLNPQAQRITSARHLSYIDWYRFMCDLHGLPASLTAEEEHQLLAEVQAISQDEDAAERILRRDAGIRQLATQSPLV